MKDALAETQVLVGVTGSIAAYKAAEVVRLLLRCGARVQVAMTRSAEAFIRPLTFQALTGRPVLTDIFELDTPSDHLGSAIQHVERAHSVDLVLVAPATANAIARLAGGFADDVLSAIILATRAPVMLAPAMETGMWENQATVANVALLRARGMHMVGPVSGALASQRMGSGRMADPEAIVEALARVRAPGDLLGVKVLITAGPTWEALDPVRVLSNRSTGSMGIELSQAAHRRGAEVVLLLGPTLLEPPRGAGLRVVRVESAEDMLQAGWAEMGAVDVLIASAAVSDFRPELVRSHKLKRQDPEARSLRLVENPDLLATLGKGLRSRSGCGGTGRPTVVGFAAETENLAQNAHEKLVRKDCDLMIANLVRAGAGFGATPTAVVAIDRTGLAVEYGPAPKSEVADFVLDQILIIRKEKTTG